MKVSKYTKKPEEEGSSAHQDTFGKNESSPERAKDRHTVPCMSPVRQTILKSAEEQEHENIEEDKRCCEGTDLEAPAGGRTGEQEEATCFKTCSRIIIFQEPFAPKKEKKSIAGELFGSLVPEPFYLVIEKRAKELQEQEEKMSVVKDQRPAVGGGQAAGGRAAEDGAGQAMERTEAQGKPNMEIPGCGDKVT
ncbi:Targeting protein for Xklp2 [Myotis davidii]|uniref:Targeting protein for Xklp2 n=1 Tax=Myotis davidii TaxID=225400 RepID=L5LQ39_MYODS|nr:Targeting protein for Xklp2 [Myotis davidii]